MKLNSKKSNILGIAMTEYLIILAIVAIASIGATSVFGGALKKPGQISLRVSTQQFRKSKWSHPAWKILTCKTPIKSEISLSRGKHLANPHIFTPFIKTGGRVLFNELAGGGNRVTSNAPHNRTSTQILLIPILPLVSFGNHPPNVTPRRTVVCP